MKEDNIEQQHTEETPEKNRVIAWGKRTQITVTSCRS